MKHRLRTFFRKPASVFFCAVFLLLPLNGCKKSEPASTEPAEPPVSAVHLTQSSFSEDNFTIPAYGSSEASRPATPFPIHGIYISGPVAGISKMDTFIEMASETELNAFVIDIKNDSGEVTYHMNTEMVQEVDSDINYIQDIETLIQKCKDNNIYLIARIVAFKDPYLAQARPDLAIHNADGSVYYDNSGLAWVNPYETEVWDYLIEIATEAARLGFDEIQFDYLRFSTDRGMSEVDFGPNAEGKTKTEIIAEFTQYAHETLSAIPVRLSADVFGTVIDNRNDQDIVGQDYYTLSTHLDVICPMIYPSHYSAGVYGISVPDAEPYETITAALIASRDALETHGNGMISSLEDSDYVPYATVRPWLQAFTATWVNGHIDYTPEEVRAQIQAVYDAGYEEWILWNAGVNYDAAYFLPNETDMPDDNNENSNTEDTDSADET